MHRIIFASVDETKELFTNVVPKQDLKYSHHGVTAIESGISCTNVRIVFLTDNNNKLMKLAHVLQANCQNVKLCSCFL